MDSLVCRKIDLEEKLELAIEIIEDLCRQFGYTVIQKDGSKKISTLGLSALEDALIF